MTGHSNSSSSGRLMNKNSVEGFFTALAKHIDPKSELNWQTPLDLLIAVVLSAQTTDKAVNRVTEQLWRICRTPQDYLTLGEKRLQEIIHEIGLYRNKSKAITGICTALLERHEGTVPSRRDELEALPGVGRKTANVVLNVVFRQPTLAVDTHVFRVANRTGLVQAATPKKTEEALMLRVPARFLPDAHHYLILHGRYTCTARSPKCRDCTVREFCLYPEKEK